MKKIMIVCFLATLAGCATVTPEYIANREYGPYPEDYKNLIQHYFDKRLKDPYSANYEYFAGPSHIFRKASFLGPELYGWGVCVNVNAKNSYGGYTGAESYAFVFRNNDITNIISSDGAGLLDKPMVIAMCKKIKETEANFSQEVH